MDSKQLYYFIGQCLTLEEFPEKAPEIQKEFESGNFPFEQFVHFCSNNYIIPSIYVLFKRNRLLAYLPYELGQLFEEIYRLNKDRNGLILLQIQQLCSKLNEENIEPVFLKGTGNMLDHLYLDAGERLIGDIDLLVSEDDFLKTIELVKSMGYKTDILEKEIPIGLKHFPRLYKKNVPADIEIHRMPVNQKNLQLLNAKDVIRRKTVIDELTNCFVPADEDKIMINFIHSQIDHLGYFRKVCSFRDLYDYYRLSRRLIGSDFFNRSCNNPKALAYFLMANQILGISTHHHTKVKSVQFHLFITDWFLDHLFWFRVYRIAGNIFQLIFIRYLFQLFQAIFKKEVRRSVLKRLLSAKWYIAHFASYKELFN